ncbi:helix-turn-helix domain-containing protein [Microbacterium sp. F51-2R]|jgi:predicted ArsR family transcriptional regulator|uniref:helix-turn-helix domain-containing protein n=1 Tax=Microbacterium sp. F51-2R TaxID=3445777 RepID=UPI003FA0D0C2
MTRRVDAYRGLSQPSRLRVMHELLVKPGQSLADLAAATGLHENTLRDHLRVLEAEGFVVRRPEHRGTRGRPRDVFDPAGPQTPNPVAERRIEDAKRHGDLLRGVVLQTTAADETVAHQLDVLYEHLDDVGLEPRIDEEALTVDLAPCAFHDLVDDRMAMLCHVHAELIRGVLQQAGGPLELDRVLPLVTPHRCHVALKVAAPGAAVAD